MRHTWYKDAVVYQIYPRSFQDSNGDGIGDLQGIINRLPYLAQLGITIIWLSPIYQSPNDDGGYDISDYCAIQKEFGTMAIYDEFLNRTHQLGMKVIMDLVVNHTSDEHPWFIASKQEQPNQYHNYYFWRKTQSAHQTPNNWSSFFGGSAWKYDADKKQHFLHLFSPKQPDLNWGYPPVREEIKKMMRFWLDKGIDGFRCDVITIISKKPGLPNGRFRLVLKGFEHYANGPHVHDYLQELHRDVLSHYDVMTVGEATFIDAKTALTYVAEDRKELDMVIHFDHMNVDSISNKWLIVPWHVKKLKKILAHWQYEMIRGGGWNCLYFENHDQPRSLSRFGNTETYRVQSGKLLATYLLTQQGTPFIYQGQEIGMENYPFQSFDDFIDVEARRIYTLGKRVLHLSDEFLFKTLSYMSRDNARTPMQWDSSVNAGFTTGHPWMKVHPNYPDVNVEKEINNPDSIWNFYRQLIALRKDQPTLIYGSFQLFLKNHPHLVVYQRLLEEDIILVLMNFSTRIIDIRLPRSVTQTRWQLLVSNYAQPSELPRRMQPYEVLILKKKSNA